MKKIISLVLFGLLVVSSVTNAFAIEPRAAVGQVTGFTDSSRTGALDVTSIVPSPISAVEHQFSADTVVAQNCPVGQPCYDVMSRAYSGFSAYGQRLYRYEADGHTGKGRNPYVESYRNVY